MATSTSTASGSLASVGLNGSAGKAIGDDQQSVDKFLASMVFAVVILVVEIVLFVLIKDKLQRIYRPRTFMVSEREQTTAPPTGPFKWIIPLFKTSNSEFIGKCGLDAYFFLRYLRTLLKIFLPIAALALPILLPLNAVGGRGQDDPQPVVGLSQLGWANIRADKVRRYWVHLILAVAVICWICFVVYQELRGYIRVRQAYLTSPQHRLRASATTVLVSAIPRDWLSLEALEGLYDVFPGGIRNIWINRDFSKLMDKIDLRNKYAKQLESAETELIKKANKAYRKQQEAERKRKGQKLSKAELEAEKRNQDEATEARAAGKGRSAGDPQQVLHTIAQILGRKPKQSPSREPTTAANPNRLQRGVNALGRDIKGLGKAGFGWLDRSNNSDRATRTASDETGQYPRRGDSLADQLLSTVRNTDSSEGTLGAHTEDSIAEDNQSHQPASSHRGLLQRLQRKGPSITLNDGEDVESKAEEDEVPLSHQTPTTPHMNSQPTFGKNETQKEGAKAAGLKSKLPFMNKEEVKPTEYPQSYKDSVAEESDDPRWKRYIKSGDRPTMRLAPYGQEWLSFLPFVGKKVDTIYFCRKELARLNVEVETDQNDADKYPLMNSAFIQFNHQVAAHLACQAVSHHLPQQMAPRHVEVAPGDVIWDNMSIRWWERWLRSAIVIVIVAALIVGWGIPVAFTGLLSQLSYLTEALPWLGWLNNLPNVIKSLIQGVLPPALLGLLMFVLPMVLRFLAKQSGVPTGMSVELSVQNMFFFFSFVQIFLVVSLSASITTVFEKITRDPTSTPTLLAQSIPRASTYFFQYMLLQAFSVSGGDLVQVAGLVLWALAPILDSTLRQKWYRQITLSTISWGTFFPVYTNLACIGIIFSIISPLMLIFSCVTFSLFWVAYRYNTLYVNQYRFDTGGLLFPRALNQLFTGVYFMELILIGLFLLVRDENDRVAAIPQAAIMVVVGAFTIIFQLLTRNAFGPLYRYLPITLEDDAVARDEEFARSQHHKWNLGDANGESLQDALEDKEQRQEEQNRVMEAIEMQRINSDASSPGRGRAPRQFGDSLSPTGPGPTVKRKRGSWAAETRTRSRSRLSHDAGRNSDDEGDGPRSPVPSSERKQVPPEQSTSMTMDEVKRQEAEREKSADVEAQQKGDRTTNLFAGLSDEIEDLTPEERDKLVERAFRHEALRARRPVIWIPADELGVADDEIAQTEKVCGENVWISSEGAALDRKGKLVYRKNPPDFSEVDLIEL